MTDDEADFIAPSLNSSAHEVSKFASFLDEQRQKWVQDLAKGRLDKTGEADRQRAHLMLAFLLATARKPHEVYAATRALSALFGWGKRTEPRKGVTPEAKELQEWLEG